MKLNILTMAIGALAFGSIAAAAQAPSPAQAQQQSQQPQPKYKRNLPDSLMREAKMSEADAIAAAKKAVPNGHVASIELEREGGKLIYSMDVRTRGKSGIDEVNVDAKTGTMVGSVQHENAAAESAEAAAEAAPKKASPAKKP